MLKNYFKVAFRNLWRNKVFSLINILGLAIGISSALVIYLIVQHEYSYEKFQKDGKSIYRVVSKIEFPDLIIHNSGVPVPTARGARDEITGLEAVTHFVTDNDAKVAVPVPGNQSPAIFKNQRNIIYADEYYFQIFQYDWLAGVPQTALKDPFQVVLTESSAKRYFSSMSPNDILGKQLIYDDSIKVTVSGIVKDIEQQSDFVFNQFISRVTVEHTGLKDSWNWEEWDNINSDSQLFVKLKKGTNPKQVETQLVALRDKYRERNQEDKANDKDDIQHFLQPLSDLHFNSDYSVFNQRQANRPTLMGLFAVAIFLLVLGCINFINLTTAQASQRAREIGVRKTLGSKKSQLITQFLCETTCLTFLATTLSIVITPWLLNIFSDFIPPDISFASLNHIHVWVFLISLIIVVSILSGIYPAWVLTKFRPVSILKNQAVEGGSTTRKARLRKTLTITQFVIAQFLLIATLVVSKQIHFSLNKDLGYKQDAIVFFSTPWRFSSDRTDTRKQALLEKLKAIPEIEKISLSSTSPASHSTSTTTMKFDDGKRKVETMVETKQADTAYFDLYQMKLLAGRNLLPSDTTKEFVINETYAKTLGFSNPADAIGQVISANINIPIVGVIRDFQTKSTHVAIKPLAYSAASSRSHTFHLGLKAPGPDGENWTRALAKAEKAYKELYPEDDFSYTFFDKTIASFYTAEKNISRLLKWSSGLCILISCLGLLGLVIYITNTRTKEIGVRKVLGASVIQIISLLSRDFISLVLIAFVITLPIAWWVMHQWLQDFVYRTPLSWWLFAITGAGMIIIAALTLSLRTIKSASANPVKSLRTE